MSNEDLLAIHRKLVADNNVDEGLIYMQIPRGNADRDFNFPSKDTPPVVVMFSQARPVLESPLAKRGLKVISLPDIRWGRRDIKTVQLLYPSMAKKCRKRSWCRRRLAGAGRLRDGGLVGKRLHRHC